MTDLRPLKKFINFVGPQNAATKSPIRHRDLVSAPGPVQSDFYRMGFGRQFPSTDFFVLWNLRFLPPFFFVWRLGAVGCASRAGRVAIGLERTMSPPTPRRKLGRLLKNHSKRWGASPLTFLMKFQGPRGHPDPQNRRFVIL